MNTSSVVKSGLVGALGSLVMFIIMMIGISQGMAPFKLPPSAAFLKTIGLHKGPLPLIVHFGYGMTWSVVLVALVRQHTSIAKGLFVALALWLFMMLVYSPMIGWGFFGFGSTYEKGAELYLQPGPKYLIITLVLHIIYGLIIGGVNPLWIEFDG